MSAGPRSLGAIQKWFQAVVTHPDGVEGAVESEAAQQIIRLNRGELEAVIMRSRNLTAAERLGIYANSYYARLLECLGECFPVLKRTVGEEIFSGFAFEYLQRYPSRSYTLDRLGENFPRFLEETRPGPEDGGPPPGEVGWPDFLIELAALEWNLAKVFDGPGIEGQAVLTPESLRAFPAERFTAARLHTVPCLRLLVFRFPVNAYFTAARNAQEGVDLPLPGPALEHTALTRRDYVVRRFSIQPAQYALLAALQSGATVGKALAAAAAVTGLDDDALADALRSWFRMFTAEGFFRAIG